MKSPNFPRAIRSLFPPPRRFVQRLSATEPAAGRGGVVWVLARALVHYKLFPLEGIPKNQRVALLRMQIRQWTPYTNAGSCVVIEGDSAMVWLWNKARVDEAVAAAGLAPSRVKVIPETLLEPQLNNGLRLLQTLDGTEAQVWKSNTLAASRWWPAAPPADEWLAFQRDAGLAEHAALPGSAQTAPLLAEPWARVASLEDYRALDSRNERLIYAIGIVLLAAATFWYGSFAIKRNAAVNAARAELSELNSRAEPVIAARNEAQAVLLRTQALLALDPYPDPLQLMARVGEILPKNGSYVREWNYLNGKLKLMIVVPDSGMPSSVLVNSLQTAGPFNNVRAATGGDSKTFIFNMDVNPRGVYGAMIFDKYVAEFRNNLRLRLLLAGVVAILWLFAVINLRDLAIAKYQQFVGIERQIAKTKLQASQADWPQRLQAIKLLQVELEGRLWQNSTQGLAQAAFQDWLNQAAIRANLGRPAVTMLAVEDKADSGPVDSASGAGSPDANLWRVRAKIEFDFTQPGLMNLLRQVTMNPQQVVVESLNIRKEPVPRVDMLLVANFQKTAKK